MRNFWLMNRHGADGPSALVETDGRLQVTGVVKFGSAVTELADQQKVWDEIVGQIAPTLKPCVNPKTVDDVGIDPHDDLNVAGPEGSSNSNRAARRVGGQTGGGAGGRAAGGPSRSGSRGER